MNVYVAMVLSVLTCLVGLGLAIWAAYFVHREKTRGVFMILLAAIAFVMLGGPLGAKLRTFSLKPGGLEFALEQVGLPDDKENAVLARSAQAIGAAVALPTSDDPKNDTKARALEYGRELATYIQRCGFTPVPPVHAAIELGSIVRVAGDGSVTVVARPKDLGLRLEPTQGPAPIATSIRTKTGSGTSLRQVEWVITSPTVETASLAAMSEVVAKAPSLEGDAFVVIAILRAKGLTMQELHNLSGGLEDERWDSDSASALMIVEDPFVLGIQLIRVSVAPARQ